MVNVSFVRFHIIQYLLCRIQSQIRGLVNNMYISCLDIDLIQKRGHHPCSHPSTYVKSHATFHQTLLLLQNEFAFVK